MKLKNYTTTIPVDRSIGNIERLLIDFGASHIMKEANNGKVSSIAFKIMVGNNPVSFRLPAEPKACYLWLKQNNSGAKKKVPVAKLEEQGERLAWKHLHDWVYVQLTGVTLSQIEIVQALLPYAMDSKTGETFYQKLKGQDFKLLNNG